MNAVEMRTLCRICGVSLADQIRNKEIHRMAGPSEDVKMRMKINVLNWFEPVERMRDERMIKNIYLEKSYVEIVAFGTLFSLIILGIQHEVN